MHSNDVNIKQTPIHLVEKYSEKNGTLFAGIMDLEKAYDRVDRKGLWHDLMVYGVGEHLVEGIIPLKG